jgi:hypothetical protein
LAGNFIGTAASGVQALGNDLDGVAIVNGSDHNSLLGTFLTPPGVANPFIFYNVISGNRGNGLRVSDSDGTRIHANFFGLGSDDKTPVGNGLNGVVVEGTSDDTEFGGRFPLGNVVAANVQNGVVVKDSASHFTAFNTFCGLGAFSDSAKLGNGQNGMLITATGGNNVLLFNLVSSNGGNGIEIGGEASGVQVVKNGIGVNLDGTEPLPNGGNGVEITGNAHGNTIGGTPPPRLPTLGGRNVIEANGGYGVAITGAAHDNKVNGSAIGQDGAAKVVGNSAGGVFLGPGTAGTIIGSADQDPHFLTTIGGNLGPGIVMNGARDNIVIGTRIGIDEKGDVRPNQGDGILIVNSSGNFIGGAGASEGNVIAANCGNGIALDNSSGNVLRANFIGTDATGTRDRGNAGNGILVTGLGARNNTIGGTTPAYPPGTKPPDFSANHRPPEGNLISGNAGNGVLLTGGASGNFLFGNFIGTAASGVRALGNDLDGVAIVNAPGNTLAGTTQTQDPFIFYNVVSGNRGNGLRIHDSDRTVIQANFFGLGSDDKTPVRNAFNGVLVEGSSADTLLGGRIPLGNVVAANGHNGVVVQDAVRGFTAFNTFCGVGAFVDYPNLGNGRDGFLITSTGGNNLIFVNQISGNGGNGVEISGNARGVRVTKNVIGVNANGTVALPNRGNGVEIGGGAHDNVIGGPEPEPTIGPHNVISGNFGYGVAVTGTAHDNLINFSYIGTDRDGGDAIGNHRGGVLLGPGTWRTIVGSTDPQLLTLISGNHGSGIEMSGTADNRVIGTIIGADSTGRRALANHHDGILIVNSSGNQIGGIAPGEANVIAFNHRNGVWVHSGQGNAIRRNSIFDNKGLGIKLSPHANNDQTAPVLTSATAGLLDVRVSGTLTGTPNTTYTVELFADTTVLPNGSAQGRTFLRSVLVTTDANGFASFSVIVHPPVDARALTATATDPLGNTSEFSDALLLPS